MKAKPNFAYVATQNMKLNGVDYQRGDPINLDGVSIPRIRQLVDTRKIIVANSVDLKAKPAPEEAAEVAVSAGKVVVETPPAPDAPQDSVQATGAPAGALTSVHKGFGRHDVLRDGEVIEAGVTKARLAELGL